MTAPMATRRLDELERTMRSWQGDHSRRRTVRETVSGHVGKAFFMYQQGKTQQYILSADGVVNTIRTRCAYVPKAQKRRDRDMDGVSLKATMILSVTLRG
jgi:hypothetical protein